jgi:hypothetical protein
MTAVYAPLQNADPTRRGAVTNAAQEIAGLKKFLDGLESAQLVVANDYDPEPLTIEGDPFTANGMPFSLGGPTVADDPFWGVRAQAIDSGGPAGIVEEFAVGRFPGNGPLDLLGPDYLGQGVLPGLSFGINAFLSQAALLADEVLLGLNDAGDGAAIDIDEGRAIFRVPVHLEDADAELISPNLAFRFSDGFNQLKLRLPSNTDTPGGYELWGDSVGGYPLSLNRDDQLVYSLRASLLDATLGSPHGAVHAFTVDLSVLDEYLAVFGKHDGIGFDNFASAFRISSKGAPEIVEKENLGPVSDWASGADADVDATAASGVLQAPASGTYTKVFINTPECKAGSLPRVITVGNVESGGGVLLIPYVSAVSDGQFVVEFKASNGSGAAAWASGGGQLRWEISR